MATKKKASGDVQRARTEANRIRNRKRSEIRQAKLIDRAQKLVGQHVAVRKAGLDKPLIGTVLEVIRKENREYPVDAVRDTGQYLKVRTTLGNSLHSRHRVKPIQEKGRNAV